MIPTWAISAGWAMGAFLFIINIYLIFKYNNLTIQYLLDIILTMFIALTPALLYFSGVYLYFTQENIPIEMRQEWARGGLAYFAFAMIASQIHIIWLRYRHRGA
jgi:hypothetical protein